MKGKTDVFTVLSFFPFLAPSLSGTSVLMILYICGPCLFLSRTHIFSCDSFFQFSLVLLLPSLLTFFPLFSLLYPPLSPAPLLSPSERLRIPKGADAIKMLILSVYREREKEGGGWQHEGLRLTWRTRLKWRTGGWGGHWGRCVCVGRGVRWKGGGRGCVLGRRSEKGDASEGKDRQG